MRIFITGGSGCVGHYLVEHFLADPAVHLTLLLRNPAKLNLSPEHRDRVTIIEGDLTEGAAKLPDGAEFDLGILAATAWGGPRTFEITVDANLALADRLIALGCPRIIYFATASVLSRDLKLIDEARAHGTAYIRSKHKLVEEIEKRSERADIIGFFPTVIFGGGEAPVNAPQSHLVRMLFENKKWLPVARRISSVGKLHLIHPGDIATLAGHFGRAESAGQNRRIVLGNDAVSVDHLLGAVAEACGKRYRPLVRITEKRVETAAKLFRIKLTPWDRYNAQHVDQSYPMAVMPRDFGLPMAMPDIATGLQSVGFPNNP